jgi:hypothetical protein
MRFLTIALATTWQRFSSQKTQDTLSMPALFFKQNASISCKLPVKIWPLAVLRGYK